MRIRRDQVIWELRVVVILVGVSLLLYLLHFAWFRDMQHIYLWSFTSLAFLPISALVVTLLINRVLSARDKALRHDKLNMLTKHEFSVTVNGPQLVEGKAFLNPRVDFLMRLIENPNLFDRNAVATVSEEKRSPNPIKPG